MTTLTTPQISGRYTFQADLKGLRLPITFEKPIMPDSSPSEEPLQQVGPSHSNSDVIDSGTAIQQPQGVITDTSSKSTEQLETDSLSVSKSLCCEFAVS